MVTIYAYTKETRIVSGHEYYTVIKTVGDSIRVADNRASAYGKSINKKMAGGYFTGNSKPNASIFKKYYTVIEVPKGFKTPKKTGPDRIDLLIAYESGEMSGNDTIEFFSDLIKDGSVWTLQGHYGRFADELIVNGFIDKKGKILKRI